MQALILAGGKGTRLRPYTTVLPKPLMPIGDLPILEIILRQLKDQGFSSVILAVGYMSQLFESFFKDGARYGLEITYSFEEKPLGTAGPISLVLDQLDDNFLVMNGDLLTTINYKELFDHHVKLENSATIATHQREVHIDYGVIDSGSDGLLEGYREKPSFKFDVSMGINVLNRNSILPYVKKDEFLDIPDLMKKLSQDSLRVECWRSNCTWLDIGRVDDYQVAIDQFEENKMHFLPNWEKP